MMNDKVERFNAYFDEATKADFEHLEQKESSALIALLDDLVQVIAQESNAEWGISNDEIAKINH